MKNSTLFKSKEMIRKLIFCSSAFILLFAFSKNSFAQSSTLAKDSSSHIPFYKWEIGIDLLPLIDKQKDAFGYIVKRNYQVKNGRSALRFRILPYINNQPLPGASINATTINLAIGYERQHLLGRFAYLYGVEPKLLYYITKTESDLKGLITRFREYSLGLDGFLGGRFYVSNHLSLTLESHIGLRHYDSKLMDKSSNVAQAGSTTNELLVTPIHTLFLSYHF